MTNGWIPPKGSQLTKYEACVLNLVAQGKSNLEIGKLLHRTPPSVSTCTNRIKYKLGVECDLRHAVLAEQYRQLHKPYEWKVATGGNMDLHEHDSMDDLRYRIQKALGR